MRWTSLGHAAWLVEAGGLRVLCDPVLGDVLHGGLHVAHPPRRVDAGALAPDLVLVSHVHPDHFDVASLADLACRWPEVPVLSPDPLVVESCRALGFAHAWVLPAGKALTLGDLTLVTTRSRGAAVEWGVVVADATAVVWNQVDSVLDAALVRDVRAGLRALLGRDLDLAIVHWCPLAEIEAAVGGSLGFPFAAWAEKLAGLAALEVGAIVPAAAGFRHLGPFAWRDAHVFPATEGMLARDLALAAPRTRVLPTGPGHVYDVEGAEVRVGATSPLVEPLPCPVLEPWAPLEVPPLVDPALGGETADEARRAVDPWIDGPLVAAVAGAWPSCGVPRPVRLALEVVLPGGARDLHAFTVGPSGVERGRDLHPDHDALVQVAGSMLADVVGGRRHWGEPLLAGLLRGARRLATLPALFPYLALPYRESLERRTRGEVARMRAASGALG